ncbi:DUF3293 domain-containing protein [Myxococcus sp. MISCRS1]|uniref:DUF3293 domain-containing protein n=1 Tax=unclassified Myxococcus TaxID=2648731 RepID=UPI001CC0C521|nr:MULTISPECIES: DUF3293 domain-containing protein [unclassified Myxococcus]MBZ4396052.1 DUF3293 domain-containing protein [Myxococcus sp. AS-1-15]MCY1000899.1 DUF3293 domain-containing protein [Myxococcus sp. MISCRS1]
MRQLDQERLLGAYRATRYVIRPHASTGGVEQVLRVGRLHPALDAELTARGHREWAFLTAWNPGSRPRGRDENQRAQERLISQLVAGGFVIAPAIGEAEDGSWSEQSLFVPGLPRSEAERFGRAHGQVAILVGRTGGPAELLLCGCEAPPPVP